MRDASMEPTVRIGQAVIVDEGAYRAHGPAPGDIVVITPARRWGYPPTVSHIMKRVIATPGENVSSNESQVLINGTPLRASWLPTGPLGPPITAQNVPTGQYFVLGDNFPSTVDSRYFGPVPRSLIVGKVVLGGCAGRTASNAPHPAPVV